MNSTAIQIGGVLQYKLDVYCDTFFEKQGGGGVADILRILRAIQGFARSFREFPTSSPDFLSLPKAQPLSLESLARAHDSQEVPLN